jgi:hypothetical protein
MASLHCDSFHELCCGKLSATSMVVSFMDPLMALLILRSSCHTLCNWMASLQCDSLHQSSPDVEKLLSHLLHFNGCFLQGSSDCTSSLLIMKISCHTLCNWMASLHCNSLHELWCGKTTETSLVASFMDPLMVLLSISILRSSCNTLCNWMAYLQCDSLHDSSPDVEKLLSYLVHFNGCFLHVLDPEKLLPHFMQLNGFSQVWFPSCYLCCTYKKLQYYDMAV